MRPLRFAIGLALLLGTAVLPLPAKADSFFFSTGNPDGKIATASRPSGNGNIEIETGDDFILTGTTVLNSATFTG